jgi:superfamily II RNA helicase
LLYYRDNDVESKPLPSLSQHFAPDWIIERSICNNYSGLVCNQFKHLIENKENSAIDSIAKSLTPITSKDIQYPELKPTSSLIIDFILTLKEKNLLPCIVFSDDRLLCQNMAAAVAGHFEKVENQLRRTKHKNQIEALINRLELIDKTSKKAKLKNPFRVSKNRSSDCDTAAEVERMAQEDKDQIRLSGFERQLLDGILDEGTLANRHGCDRELVESLLQRADSENPKLVGYMKRGVAYHHSGLNNKGRVAVEALFRNRYVQVVFSTATLGKKTSRILFYKKFSSFSFL